MVISLLTSFPDLPTYTGFSCWKQFARFSLCLLFWVPWGRSIPVIFQLIKYLNICLSIGSKMWGCKDAQKHKTWFTGSDKFSVGMETLSSIQAAYLKRYSLQHSSVRGRATGTTAHTYGSVDLCLNISVVSYQAVACNLSDPYLITSKIVMIAPTSQCCCKLNIRHKHTKIPWVQGRCSVLAVTIKHLQAMVLSYVYGTCWSI